VRIPSQDGKRIHSYGHEQVPAGARRERGPPGGAKSARAGEGSQEEGKDLGEREQEQAAAATAPATATAAAATAAAAAGGAKDRQQQDAEEPRDQGRPAAAVEGAGG